ncbi:MAG TPA: SRPBCC family protein [Nevskiaceae bacterium]|nr:SRPBCC family protein [Nevskiaceae bacterium]
MKRIVVRRTLNAPIDRVFAALADYESYAGLTGVRRARLLRHGRSRRLGVGAVREMWTTLAFFREQITAYLPPHRLDYRIIASQPRLDHAGASVQLEEVKGGTRVTWTTSFRVHLPAALGIVGTSIAAWQTRRGLVTLLTALASQLEAVPA